MNWHQSLGITAKTGVSLQADSIVAVHLLATGVQQNAALLLPIMLYACYIFCGSLVTNIAVFLVTGHTATGGTFQSDTPGTFVSAMGGTFDSDIPGTFESATGGTFNPLLSTKADVKGSLVPRPVSPSSDVQPSVRC